MTDMERELELELVRRVRDGDAGAFDAIHAEFNTRLFNFLSRLSRCRDVAEDLLDETWLRFVDRAPKLRPDTRLGPFLFTVARNLYITYCRSRLLEETHPADAIGLWPRGARTMSRCHERLAARRRKIEARNRPSTRRTGVMVERVLLAGVCVVCLVSMAGNVLSIVRAL